MSRDKINNGSFNKPGGYNTKTVSTKSISKATSTLSSSYPGTQSKSTSFKTFANANQTSNDSGKSGPETLIQGVQTFVSNFVGGIENLRPAKNPLDGMYAARKDLNHKISQSLGLGPKGVGGLLMDKLGLGKKS